MSGTYGFFSKKIFQLFASSRQQEVSWVTITQDPNAILDQQILMASGNIYLQGYWQNEKYFDDIADIIRDDLKIIKKPNKKNAELIGIIGDTNSVAIHIRRGDYISVSESFKTHGICSLDYYKSCIQYMDDKLKKPHFFVFSDDAHMLLADLLKLFPHTFVDHNSFDEAFEDLRLMSLCKHQIIANSSLSWWGAWLNANKDKIICAPKKWIASDLPCAQKTVPDQWIKFDN